VTARPRGFDRMARWYRLLEFLAFGADLEAARFEYLGRLSGCRDIVLLGEGDGRCAARVAAAAPQARILCVDSSPGMIGRAQRRIADLGASDRVRFACADARTFDLGQGVFDGAATLFFLDCFSEADAASLVGRVTASLRPGAPWLFSDFVLPAGGLRRLRAGAWLRVLYACFRWETGIGARALPPSEELLAASGWVPAASRERQLGLLRSSVYVRAPAPTGARGASP